MASIFDPGTSGTLKSTKLPTALLEMSAILKNAELAIVTDAPNNIQISSSFDTASVSISASLPITTSLNTSGQPVITATDYLTAASGSGSFTNGGGDLKSTHKAAAFLELAQKVHAAEKASSADPQPDNVQISYDVENLIANITVNLPQTVTVNSSGAIQISATDYL